MLGVNGLSPRRFVSGAGAVCQQREAGRYFTGLRGSLLAKAGVVCWLVLAAAFRPAVAPRAR